MGRARSAVAVRASIEELRAAAVDAFGVKVAEAATTPDFDEVIDFSRPHSEELGGEPGQNAWHFWQVKQWALIGDLTLLLTHNPDGLLRLAKRFEQVVVAGIDSAFEYACFAYYEGGALKRRLVLEEEEIIEEGLPIKAERGRHLEDFTEEEAERLWTSFGLPTFEYEPLDGPFVCVAVKLV